MELVVVLAMAGIGWIVYARVRQLPRAEVIRPIAFLGGAVCGFGFAMLCTFGVAVLPQGGYLSVAVPMVLGMVGVYRLSRRMDHALVKDAVRVFLFVSFLLLLLFAGAG